MRIIGTSLIIGLHDWVSHASRTHDGVCVNIGGIGWWFILGHLCQWLDLPEKCLMVLKGGILEVHVLILAAMVRGKEGTQIKRP